MAWSDPEGLFALPRLRPGTPGPGLSRGPPRTSAPHEAPVRLPAVFLLDLRALGCPALHAGLPAVDGPLGSPLPGRIGSALGHAASHPGRGVADGVFACLLLPALPRVLALWPDLGVRLRRNGLGPPLRALGRSFRAGLFISFCLYKPPLLLLIVPLLIVARRWRIILGFVTGAAGLAGISLLTFGWRGCLAYAQLASEFSRLINSSTVGIRRWKYIDLNNFLGLLCGGQTPASVALWAAGVLAVIPWLARGWWDYGRCDPDQKTLLWATVLTWTLVLNIYVGAYDAILATIAALMTADVLVRRTGQIAGALGAGFREVLALLYLVPGSRSM